MLPLSLEWTHNILQWMHIISVALNVACDEQQTFRDTTNSFPPQNEIG